MGTGEKRCNDCGWEFYEGVMDEVEQENDIFKNQEVCPQCFCPDWEYKLIGIKTMQKHNISKLQNMMINIIEEGKQEVWQSIEEIKNPLERCKQRKLFAEAIKKLKG